MGLGTIFFNNWIKKPSAVLDAGDCKEMQNELTALGCTMQPANSFVEVIYNVDKWDTKAAKETLEQFKKQITPDGIIFIRTQETPAALCEMLENLKPNFKLIESYTIGKERDFLIRPCFKKPTICIGMIAKNEERDLPRCLNSLSGLTDGLVLIDTGSVDQTLKVAQDWVDKEKQTNPNFRSEIKTYWGASEKDETGDWKLWNFGKARNEYVKTIESMGFDYILWMDADDEVIEKDLLNFIYWEQYDVQAIHLESGGLRWPHHRIWKTNKGISYKGYCHEYPNWGNLSSYIHIDKPRIRHDGAPGLGENSNARNLRILQREMKEEPSPRTAFYLANTYKDGNKWVEAIEYYKKRIQFGKGYEDEYWFAVLYKGRCERLAGQYDNAKATLLKAVAEKPDWAEFLMELCYLESAKGDHYKSLAWALLAKDSPVVPTQLFREKDKYTDQPYRQISWAYQSLGYTEQAIQWADKAAIKIGGPDKEWAERTKALVKKIYKKPTKENVTWHRPGALGDVLITLNLVQEYKRQNPNVHLIYKTHPSTIQHLEKIMKTVGVDEVIPTDFGYEGKEINLIGYPLKEGYPDVPMKKHLLEYFSEEVGLGGKKFFAKMPRTAIELSDYATVHIKAGWSMYKEWPVENWQWVCDQLKKVGINVIQIGGPDDPQLTGVINFLGKSFAENLSALSYARIHMGIDSWTNHATAFNWEGRGPVPSVILWGSTQWQAAGYDHNVNMRLNLPCQPCFRESPKISKMPRGICPNPENQTYENPKHACMMGIEKEKVLEEILTLWNENDTRLFENIIPNCF